MLIVGGGMTAHRLCARLCGDGPSARFDVTVIGDESSLAYDRVHLASALRAAPDALLLSPRAWYDARGIETVLGDAAVELDRDARVLTTASGRAFGYDLLVLATGSRAWVPPIAGADHDDVLVFRTLEDVAALARRLASAETAAVVGGGLLGLETARLLCDAGVHVHVLESSDHLMSRQLDAESSAVVHAHVSALRIDVHLSAQVTAIEQTARGAWLRLGGGPPLLVGLVVIAAGVRPRDELARQSGLAVGARGGIIVDDWLRTSDPAVFAIGECVSHQGVCYGLVGPCHQMADRLAENLARVEGDGGSRLERMPRFAGGDTSCHLKLLGVPVSAVGLYDREATLCSAEVEGGRRTLHLDGKRLLGATAVGAWPELPRVQDAIARERRISHRQLARFRSTGELWLHRSEDRMAAWPDTTVVCNCLGVTKGVLAAAVADGVVEVEALSRRTGAGSLCGGCRPLLAELAGTTVTAPPARSTRWVQISSVLALALCAVLTVSAPVPFANSVQPLLHAIDRLWREETLKQVSGFALLAISLLGLLVSLRKRFRWMRWGSFGGYRALHTVTGALALSLLVVHTGMRFGNHLNFALSSVFVALAAMGAVSGMAAALEVDHTSALAVLARRWRPRLTFVHLVLLWPLPVLLGAHVLVAYYF